MAYFADLTPYTYYTGPLSLPGPALNVGWLERSQPYPRGETSQAFRDKLRYLCLTRRSHVMRGFHRCPFCKEDHRSNAELRVRGRADGAEGIELAAPSLVAHYVEAHSYLPPPAFIAAVESAIPETGPDAEAFAEFLRASEGRESGADR